MPFGDLTEDRCGRGHSERDRLGLPEEEFSNVGFALGKQVSRNLVQNRMRVFPVGETELIQRRDLFKKKKREKCLVCSNTWERSVDGSQTGDMKGRQIPEASWAELSSRASLPERAGF